MSTKETLRGLARRERKGSEKRQIAIKNIQRMLPGTPMGMHGGNVPPGTFSGETTLMAMEDAYCDMWDRTEVIDTRTRSLLNASLMIGVGNTGNQFELQSTGPAPSTTAQPSPTWRRSSCTREPTSASPAPRGR